jgi:hypothetical protein
VQETGIPCPAISLFDLAKWNREIDRARESEPGRPRLGREKFRLQIKCQMGLNGVALEVRGFPN